jgi:hypothetical protein
MRIDCKFSLIKMLILFSARAVKLQGPFRTLTCLVFNVMILYLALMSSKLEHVFVALTLLQLIITGFVNFVNRSEF